MQKPNQGSGGRSRLIIGLDYHPSFQQIAFMDDETGEFSERQLLHQNGEAEKFYRELKQRGVKVRIGMEATGHSRWFEQLLGGLNIELWVARPDRNRWEHARPVLRTVTQRNDFRAYAGK